jgi:hypothetical protein
MTSGGKRDTVDDQTQGERREQPVERAGQAKRKSAATDHNDDAEKSGQQGR